MPQSKQPIGLLYNGLWSQYFFANAPKYRDFYRLLYIHDLDASALQDLQTLSIPFQTDQAAIAAHKDLLEDFLGRGGKIAVFGDTTPEWIDAQWEDRPVNNYWWGETPDQPPIGDTDRRRPAYEGLTPRHACWHIHGIYTRIPLQARAIQTNEAGEVINWQTEAYRAIPFGSTLDPIDEHGIQQIRHLDHYVDSLTQWLCGIRPQGAFTIPA